MGDLDAAEALETFGPASVIPLATALKGDASWAVRRLAAFVQEQRVHAVPEVILREGRDVDAVILASSRGADLVFLGLRTPGETEATEE